MQRQADRLSSGGKAADEADPYELVKSDLLGVSITNLDDSADWRKLRGMIGLDSVKEAVRMQAELVKTNLVLEEAGKPPRGVALNRCMIGNPGTGELRRCLDFCRESEDATYVCNSKQTRPENSSFHTNAITVQFVLPCFRKDRTASIELKCVILLMPTHS